MNKYWIIKGTRQEGPFTLEQLKIMSLQADVPVWREGLSDWTHAYDVPELAPWTSFEPVKEETTVEDTVVTQKPVDGEYGQQSTEVIKESVEEIVITDASVATDSAEKANVHARTVNSRRKDVEKREAEVIYAPIGEVPDGYMALTSGTGKPKCPSSYLALSIISTILFFLPFGVCAIFCSAKVEPHYQAGRYEQAYKMSNRAQLFIVLSIVCMLIWLPFSIVFAML